MKELNKAGENKIVIQVSFKLNTDKTDGKYFMSMIDCLDSATQEKILGYLDPKQKNAVDSYMHLKEVDEEELRNLLIVSTKDQIENLILDLRDEKYKGSDPATANNDKNCSSVHEYENDKSNLDEILEFLIRKNK